MANKSKKLLSAELRRFLRKYPKTGAMELLIPDMLGILKCKRIRKSDFEKVCDEVSFSAPARSC